MASCSLACSVKELGEELMDAGNKLLTPPSSVDELLGLLDKVENLLSKVGQDPPVPTQDALLPLMKALIGKSLLEHSDVNIKVFLVSCISELCRITAPDAPYGEELMKEIFKLVAIAFEKLSDASSRCYPKAVNILANAARVRFCVLLLDLEFEALLIEIFQLFFKVIRVDHPLALFNYMEDIMTWIIEESDDISAELLKPILFSLKRENENASPISSKLGAKVLRNCAAKVRPFLRQAVRLMSLNFDDYAELVSSICRDAFDRKNVETERLPMDALHLVQGGSVLGNGNAEIRNSNGMPKENSLRKLEIGDQIEQLKKADRCKKLNVSGDGQPEDVAATSLRKRVVKIEEGIFDEEEGKQEQLIQHVDSMKQVNDQSTFEKHATGEVGAEVSACAKTKSRRKRPLRRKEESKKRSVTKDKGEDLVGMRIKVWWPLDQRFYDGVISSYDTSEKKHTVLYADGDEENLILCRERWELLDDMSTGQEQNADVQSPTVSFSKKQNKKPKIKLEASTDQECDTAASSKS